MGIFHEHTHFYKEIFDIPGFFSEPAIVFGFQEIGVKTTYFEKFSNLPLKKKIKKIKQAFHRKRRAFLGLSHSDFEVPQEFRARDIVELLGNRGIKDVSVIDLFDDRADKRYDMNQPVPPTEHDRYGLFLDIGSIEHVFDTRQCIENSLRMVRTGGIYMLHTCVNGYFAHGFHTFNPEALVKSLTLNSFEIIYHRYSTPLCVPLRSPLEARDVLIWLVARKLARIEDFILPQQDHWETKYY